jgi:heptosyltransferase-1
MSGTLLLPEAPRRVLIVRLSAIGDVIMSSGLIPVLHAAWPQADIVWLTDEGNAPLLSHNPRLAAVLALPRRRWSEFWRSGRRREAAGEALQFVRALRARRFDLALDLQGLLKSGVWTLLCGASRRVGLGSREGSALLMSHVVGREVRDDRLGKEYRLLATALGLDAERFAMDVVTAPQDDLRARAALDAAGVVGDYCALAPFTTRPQKHWLDERWSQLGERLGAEHGWRPVLLGGPADRERGQAIADASSGAIVSLAGRTSLTEAAAVIRDARALIGVDTGLTHLGIAMRTPTLALFGSTRPYADPGAPRARVLYHAMPCSPCRRRPTCNGRYDCMRLHTVDSVAQAVARLAHEADS